MVQISERPPKEGGFQKKGNARDPLTSGPGVFSAGRFFKTMNSVSLVDTGLFWLSIVTELLW